MEGTEKMRITLNFETLDVLNLMVTTRTAKRNNESCVNNMKARLL